MKVQDVHPRLTAGLQQTIKLAEMTRDYYQSRIVELEHLIWSCQQCMAEERLPANTREAEQHETIANSGRAPLTSSRVDALREALTSTDKKPEDAALVAVERALEARPRGT